MKKEKPNILDNNILNTRKYFIYLKEIHISPVRFRGNDIFESPPTIGKDELELGTPIIFHGFNECSINAPHIDDYELF